MNKICDLNLKLEIDSLYSLDEIIETGLIRNMDVIELNAIIFNNQNHVYFFERMDDALLRLYSVINKRSFYL
jgi:hypothetical protein